jgi:DNA transformation protein and related proteins
MMKNAMPLSAEFLSRATAQLNAARPVRTRKMFGGLGIYLGEAFFGVCDDDKTFFKVDDENIQEYESRGMGPWIMGGQINDNYREVPDGVMADPGELGDWIDAAAEVAARRKKK